MEGLDNMKNELPSSDGVLIPGRRGKLFAHYYLPGGEYPKPVVIVCHGIPGNERLFDFSIFFRENGFCTLNFHYSGSWGSDGDYSVSHCFEDTASVVEYAVRNENGWFDVNNIFVVGHSLGGLMASYAISSLDAVRGGAILAPFNARLEAESVVQGENDSFLCELFSDENGDKWLKDFSRKVFVDDMIACPEKFDLKSYAEGLSEKPVFIATCNMDSVCPKEDHGLALAEEIQKFDGAGVLKYMEYDTDHTFNMLRSEVKKDICDFLTGNVVK